MQSYEYRVIPAPRKGEKARGLKTVEERFAYVLTSLMNKMGVEGWEYQRSDALPCEERVGLTGSKTTFQNMLVFRRPLPETLCEEVATTALHQQQRLLTADPAPVSATAPVLGAASHPIGAAPALGPADPDMVAD